MATPKATPAITSPAVTRFAYLPPALATWPDTRRRSMQVIPAIDLLDGQCVRLHQGDYDQVTRFSDDPVAQALSWQEQGAQRLHLVDLDGARTGQPVNDPVLKAITAALNIPVQLGGGVRSAARAKDLLACGLDRVILGTVALEQPELVDQLAADHPGQIVVGIDARDGKVATRGWLEASSTEATALAQRFEASGIAAIISTDIATDGTLAGPNLAALRAMAMASSVPVIASGGIGNLEHLLSLLALEPLGGGGGDCGPGPPRTLAPSRHCSPCPGADRSGRSARSPCRAVRPYRADQVAVGTRSSRRCPAPLV